MILRMTLITIIIIIVAVVVIIRGTPGNLFEKWPAGRGGPVEKWNLIVGGRGARLD